jgi:cell division protein FtsA
MQTFGTESNILAIDIGTSKIIAVVASKEEDGKSSIIGIGEEKSQGIEKGKIKDLEKATICIKRAVHKAQEVAGTHIKKAYITISGAITRSMNSSGSININSGEIDTKEIASVLNTSKIQANLPSEFEVIHILPRYFKVDEQDKLKNPIGMTGKRLEVKTRIIMTQTSLLNNIRKVISSCGLEIANFVLNGYASSLALINQSDKNFGICLVDIGGGVSDIVVYSGGTIHYDDFLAVGSHHITTDIAKTFNCAPKSAETIKRQYGTLRKIEDENDEELSINIPQNNSSESAKKHIIRIQQVLHARVEETLILSKEKIENSGYAAMLGSGIVITGGMTKIPGFEPFAKKIFEGFNIKIGIPDNRSSEFTNFSDPTKASIIGLVNYALTDEPEFEIDSNNKLRAKVTIETKSNPKPNINIDKTKEEFYNPKVDTQKETHAQDTQNPKAKQNSAPFFANQHAKDESQKKKFVELNLNDNGDKKSIWAKIVDFF